MPIVTFADPSQKQTNYTWDVATSHIVSEQGSDGNWTYKIGNIVADFGLPPITRTSPEGETEGVTVDTQMGTYASQAADGVNTITHVFETPGPLYHKVQKIEKVVKVAGKDITTQLFRASYDETGRHFNELEPLLADIKKTAPDFDDIKAMAMVNSVKLESQLRCYGT